MPAWRRSGGYAPKIAPMRSGASGRSGASAGSQAATSRVMMPVAIPAARNALRQPANPSITVRIGIPTTVEVAFAAMIQPIARCAARPAFQRALPSPQDERLYAREFYEVPDG